MTPAEAKRAAALCLALEDMAGVRKGLVRKPRYSDSTMFLLIAAYEHEGDAGGCEHATAHIDLATAPKVLAAIEQLIRDELKALGVEPDSGTGRR